MGEIKGTAYLREFEATKQCELMFSLNVALEEVGVLQEEVRAVRQITDTVESLLQHTINKIKKSLKTLQEKKSEDCMSEMEVNAILKNGSTGKPVNMNMVLKDLIHSNIRDIEFQILEQHFLVVINAPFVKELKLPQVLYANFIVQPRSFYALFIEGSTCQYTWFKSKDKENWTKVGNSYKYSITEDDIDHYLKLVCVPCNSVLTGPSAEVISDNTVEMIGELPTCPFEERHNFTTAKLDGDSFRIVSYNVLSNKYTEGPDAFSYCSPKVLAIDYRKQLIGKELLGYKSDIICLQEVDNNVYQTYFRDKFRGEGYMGFYHRKGNRISEGLACFFNKKRFKKIDDHQIIYSNEISKKKIFKNLWNFVKANTELKDCFLKQMTSLHITILKLQATNKSHCIIVGNTHLYYHPDAEIIRIFQINMATTYLNSLRKHYMKSDENSIVEVILCGDFNSVPTSAVYEYIVQGTLSKTHTIFQNCRKTIDFHHEFQFESACGKPKYTNYTSDFKDCLDYIFIEKDKMKVNSIVPFPKEEDLAAYEGLPNEVYPSDHLSLVADLEVIL